MSDLPIDITPGVTTGHVAHSKALNSRYNGESLSASDVAYGIVGDGSDESAAIMALYGDCVTTGKNMELPAPPVAYGFAYDLVFDSNRVSVIGAGPSKVPFQAIGSARIIVKPGTFTIEKGPFIGGFSIVGDPTEPVGVVGLEIEDITQADIDDIWVRGFSGAGSIGILVDTAVQTELVRMGSLRTEDCAIHIKFTNSNPALNSLARWSIAKLEMDVRDGQTGWMMRGNVNMYGGDLNLVGNMSGAGTFFDIGSGTADFCGINGGHWMFDFEQTANAAGVVDGIPYGVPYRMGSAAYAYNESGFAVFYGLLDGIVDGGPKAAPSWRSEGIAAVLKGVDSAVEGQIADFFDSGDTANVHPLLWDNKQFPLAALGVLTGNNIASPYVVMYDSPWGGFVVYKRGSGSMANMAEVFRVTNTGHVIVKGGGPPTATNQTALGTSPPAAGSAGNNMGGRFSCGSGSGPAAGFALRVTFAHPWPADAVPEIILRERTPLAFDVKAYVVQTNTHFDVYFSAAPLASQSAGTYAWSWVASGGGT